MDHQPSASVPPPPASEAELARVEHTRLRRRMIYGVAADDVRRRMLKAFGDLRTVVIGEPDLSANPFAATCSAAAALYDREPRVSHPVESAEIEMRSVVNRAALWPLMQRVQRDSLGLREMLVFVETRKDARTGVVEAVYTPVPPDMVECDADPERPDHLGIVRHAVQRPHPSKPKTMIWTRSVWDVIAAEPVYRIESMGEGGFPVGADMSALYGLPEGGQRGSEYPWRTLAGTPILPWVVYHAALTGHLWDPYFASEVVFGTLDIAVLWTWHSHIIRNAAFAVRYTIGAQLAGATLEGGEDTRHQRAVVDPTALVVFDRQPDFDGQPVVSQMAATADPLAVAEAIGIRERRLVAYAGLNPASVARQSGDPHSGYSLAVTREDQRESQRKYAPIFRPVDEELLSITATLLRLGGGPTLPETGWGVTHQMLPGSPEERNAERTEVLELMNAGILSKIEARARLLDEAPAEATAKLAAMEPRPAAPPPTPDPPTP